MLQSGLVSAGILQHNAPSIGSYNKLMALVPKSSPLSIWLVCCKLTILDDKEYGLFIRVSMSVSVYSRSLALSDIFVLFPEIPGLFPDDALVLSDMGQGLGKGYSMTLPLGQSLLLVSQVQHEAQLHEAL